MQFRITTLVETSDQHHTTMCCPLLARILFRTRRSVTLLHLLHLASPARFADEIANAERQ